MREIPDGIQFGDKILIVPGIASGFTHSGRIVGRFNGEPYQWVQRGEPIGTFWIEGSESPNRIAQFFASRSNSAIIPSPVSGLVIHSVYDTTSADALERLHTADHPPGADFSILLPDDEPPPDRGTTIFRDFARLVGRFEHYYLRDSRYWTMSGFSKRDLDGLVEAQLAADARQFDAMPRWRDYLDEARTRHPNLRPYLRHLR